LRTTAHLVRRGAYTVAVAVLATGVASVPALAATPAGTATLTANDGAAFDGLGQSTAISSNGNVAVVGSPGHNGADGAAYVFTNHGQGFSQTAELTPPATDSGDQLGTSVAISGDGQTVVSGADLADNDTGAAFVYSDQSGTFTQIAKLQVKKSTEQGISVAISADASTIVVTAPFDNNDVGDAFVFTKSGSTYKEAQELTIKSSGIALLGFDAAVSSDGSAIVLGAPLINNQAGAAFVFTKSGDTWAQTAQLAGANTAAGDNFGFTVAVSRNGATVAAGSPASNGGDGSAYVFTRSGGTFTQASQVLPPAGTSGAAAGQSIGISSDGSVLAFGAGHLNQFAGAVFVATKTNGTFAVTATDTAPNPVPDNELGFPNVSTAVAGNGSAIISGAPGRNGQTGAAFVFPVG
jgi:hypothetical protein